MFGPNVGILVPVEFTIEPGVVDNERRCIVRLGFTPHRDYIIVQRRNWYVVLHSSVTVNNLRHVMGKERAPFGHHLHAEFSGSGHYLLPLFTTWLIVTFYRKRAPGFGTTQGRPCIVEGIDGGFKITIGAVNNGTGAE